MPEPARKELVGRPLLRSETEFRKEFRRPLYSHPSGHALVDVGRPDQPPHDVGAVR